MAWLVKLLIVAPASCTSMHSFMSHQFHFQYSSLLTVWKSSRGWSKCLGLDIHVRDLNEAPSSGFSLALSWLLQPQGTGPVEIHPSL